jgi:hypothetical protein
MFDPTAPVGAGTRRPRRRRLAYQEPVITESDLAVDQAVTTAELDAIERLLGSDLEALLEGKALGRS